jgi:hypothetical protein
LAGDGFKLAGDPVSCRVDALAGGQVGLHARQSVAGTETNQGFNRLINLAGFDG